MEIVITVVTINDEENMGFHSGAFFPEEVLRRGRMYT